MPDQPKLEVPDNVIDMIEWRSMASRRKRTLQRGRRNVATGAAILASTAAYYIRIRIQNGTFLHR